MIQFARIASTLRSLSHPHKLRILELLNKHSFTPTEIAKELDIPKSTNIRILLRRMYRANIIKEDNESRYYLNEENFVVRSIAQLLNQAKKEK